MQRPRTIVFVGGGTGGHLQPGVVLRDALLRRHPDWRAQFLIAGRAVERNFVPAEATCLELFPGRSSRPSPWRADLYVRAWIAAARALARLEPDLLVFLGGYVAFIARLARWNVPMVILESNALPGRSVRLAAPFAERIFLQWPPPPGLALPPARCRVTGMPLKFEVLPPQPAARAKLGLPCEGTVLLVLGGSLGAKPLNELLMAGARDLSGFGTGGGGAPGGRLEGEAGAPAGALAVLHLAGAEDEERVRAAYAAAGVRAVVLPFSDDMASCYAAADLAVARAGGMTVAELAAAGRPAILVPYPHHPDRHQECNARALADAEAAWLVLESEAGEDFVSRVVLPRLEDRDELERRGRRALALGRRDATRRVVAEIERLLDLELPAGEAAPAAALSQG
jgi:UDP-N-acetylglucosamine--N-acetylmuramyl-(pentapeptide) pyrophosphoryl-undecaprenol N-acetylglucosamine transferase